MEATKHHDIWETGVLDASLGSLLDEYAKSVGSSDGGVPSEILQGATRIDPGQARVLASGPADCIDASCDAAGQEEDTGVDDLSGNQSAGILDGC